MKYALTLYENSWSGNRLDPTSGKVVGYRVAGMPQGEEAHIANFGTLDQSEWRIIRSNGGTEGNWTGHYESAEGALDVLRKEFD
jgi:hypothetical protein